MEVLLIIIAIILMVVGFAGLIHPAIPGLPLLSLGVWLLADVGHYQYIGSATLITVGIFTLLGMGMDFISALLGAKATGASKQALWGAFFGSFVGLFMGVIGIILGPILGAAIGEFIVKQDLLKAGKVSIGTFIGLLLGSVVKVGCAFAIMGITITVYLVSLFRQIL